MAVEDLMVLRYQVKDFGKFQRNLTDSQKALLGTEKRVDSLESRLKKLGSGVSGIGKNLGPKLGANLSGAATVGAFALIGRASIKAAANLEEQRVTFDALTKSATKTNQILGQIDKQSLDSVFSKSDLNSAGVLLSAYGMDVKKFLPVADDLAAAFRSQGVSVSDTARVFGRLKSGDFGEAFERLRDFGISQQDLAGKGLKFDKGGHFTGSAEQAMNAVEKIVLSRFSGLSKKIATTTYSGAFSNFGDALDRLETTAGNLALPRLTTFIKDVTGATSALNDLAKAHPKAFAVGSGLIGLGAGGLLLGSGINKGSDAAAGLGKAYDLVTGKRKKAAQAALGLAGAVAEDAAQEKGKSLIAGIEEKAIGEGADTALRAASAKETLAAETAEAAKKAGLFARLSNMVRGPISVGGSALQTSAVFGGRGALGSLGAQGGAKAMGLITGAGALASTAIGAVAGVSAANNMKAAGYTEGQSYMYGAATGIGAAAGAMFLPGGAVAVGLGEGVAALINHFYNKPLEKAATEGTGAQGGMARRLALAGNEGHRAGHGEQQAIYNKMASDAMAKGDVVSAESFRIMALSQGKAKNRADKPGNPEYEAAQRQRAEAYVKAHPPMSGKRDGADTGRISNATERRDGARSFTITLPESRGDASARREDYESLTPYFG